MLVFDIDNCNGAKKDGRLTVEGAQNTAIEHGHEEKTMIHGVKIRGFNIGDPFHRHALSGAHFSEVACGKTEKGGGDEQHGQIQHRQTIQANWDVYIRDPNVCMRLAAKILGQCAAKWMPKPRREIDTRWGANAKSCKNILEGFCVKNEDGDCFWVLLFKELSTHCNDWKVGRLEALVGMSMMPSLVVNCAMEHDAGSFFEAHHNWHGTSGEFSTRPGFKTLELPSELFDHAFP